MWKRSGQHFLYSKKSLNLRVKKLIEPIRADFSDFRNSDRCLFWPNYFEKLFRPEVYFWVLGNTNSEILRPRFDKKWSPETWLEPLTSGLVSFSHISFCQTIKIRFLQITALNRKNVIVCHRSCVRISVNEKIFFIKMSILQFGKFWEIRYSQKYSKTSKMNENYSWKN